MTTQHQFSTVTLDAWFQPIVLPAQPYREFAGRLDDALTELENRYHGPRLQPFRHDAEDAGETPPRKPR